MLISFVKFGCLKVIDKSRQTKMISKLRNLKIYVIATQVFWKTFPEFISIHIFDRSFKLGFACTDEIYYPNAHHFI